MIYYTAFNSPIGKIFIAKSKKGVCRIGLPGETKESFLNWIQRYASGEDSVEDSAILSSEVVELKRYFAGDLTEFSFSVDLIASPFRQKVLAMVRKIPYGTTASYKEIAERMGTPSAVRAVGNANAHNPIPIVIPCHRVIAHDGSLGGYGAGIELKGQLLELEGAL